MDFVNEFWIDMNRMQAPALDFESDFNMPPLSLDSGCDFSFDLDDLDVKIEDDYLKYMLNSVDDFDGESLESSISSDGSMMSFSPSPPILDSKTPYSDATQCRKPANNGHIRRPMNPFMVFAKQERRRMASITPNLHNAEISKICGRKWKNMTAEEKKPYEVESARLKVLHEKEYPGYKYKPKKKSKPGKKRSLSERNSNKHNHSKKMKSDQQPLRKIQVSQSSKTKDDSKSSYLMVNGQKIPLKTAKSAGNKNTFNLQLKIDENYKIVPANQSPILQILPPVTEFGSAFNGIRVKEENVHPFMFSLSGSPNDLSFPKLRFKSEDNDNNGVYLLINCPAEDVEKVACIY